MLTSALCTMCPIVGMAGQKMLDIFQGTAVSCDTARFELQVRLSMGSAPAFTQAYDVMLTSAQCRAS